MLRIQIDGHAVRLEHRLERVCDLATHALLQREPLSEQTHEPRQLRDADDVLVGDVADVGMPVERQYVVLAQGEEVDWPLDHLA
jgi:hypothetical protein